MMSHPEEAFIWVSDIFNDQFDYTYPHWAINALIKYEKGFTSYFDLHMYYLLVVPNTVALPNTACSYIF